MRGFIKKRYNKLYTKDKNKKSQKLQQTKNHKNCKNGRQKMLLLF